MMESDSEFAQSYECDDSEYNFIPGYEIEVDETTINDQRAASPRELNPNVFKNITMNRLLLRNMSATINKSKTPNIKESQSKQNIA